MCGAGILKKSRGLGFQLCFLSSSSSANPEKSSNSLIKAVMEMQLVKWWQEKSLHFFCRKPFRTKKGTLSCDTAKERVSVPRQEKNWAMRPFRTKKTEFCRKWRHASNCPGKPQVLPCLGTLWGHSSPGHHSTRDCWVAFHLQTPAQRQPKQKFSKMIKKAQSCLDKPGSPPAETIKWLWMGPFMRVLGTANTHLLFANSSPYCLLNPLEPLGQNCQQNDGETKLVCFITSGLRTQKVGQKVGGQDICCTPKIFLQ